MVPIVACGPVPPSRRPIHAELQTRRYIGSQTRASRISLAARLPVVYHKWSALTLPLLLVFGTSLSRIACRYILFSGLLRTSRFRQYGLVPRIWVEVNGKESNTQGGAELE